MSRDAVPALGVLEAQVRRDLGVIAHPSQPWLEPRTGPGGENVLDVLVVGAGQSGLAIGFGLRRAQVTNILLVDKAPRGREGPWRTYARMPTLRSPKDFTGPDLDVPSLTYQSWHEARYGEASWRDLGLITRPDWADYLDWFRDVTELPVESDTAVLGIGHEDGHLSAELRGPDGTARTVLARKVVLATGQEGVGRWGTLPVLRALPERLVARTSEPIDFAALRGRRVVVVGAGASALDNAASALEAGASVDLFCRRPAIQLVQPYRWLTFAGFLRHLSEVEDEWRWRFMRDILGRREGFPQPTWDRCARHPGFALHEGAPILAAAEAGGRAVLTTPKGRFTADLVIAATGIDTDYAARPELARFAGNIATWADRYDPPADERDDRLARFPYLAPDYAFTERVPGRTPWIADIHLFGIGATMSFGPSGSSINAMSTAVPKLVSGITRGLFRADLERHWRSLQAYDVKQAVIRRPSETGAPHLERELPKQAR